MYLISILSFLLVQTILLESSFAAVVTTKSIPKTTTVKTIPTTTRKTTTTASTTIRTTAAPVDLSNSVTFTIQNNAEQRINTTFADTNLYGCDPTGNLAIIVHGWKESCQEEWVKDLISNLTVYRGGCIMCMNYYNYSKMADYNKLVPFFKPLTSVLVRKIKMLESNGFSGNQIFVFGFSFGSQIVLEAGRALETLAISQIDVCEPAGPGFDSNPTYSLLDPKKAAVNVQCIHTSSNLGTLHRNCHQDWDMGNCGTSQLAAGPYPKGNHGLCPYFYTSAFKNKFLANKNVKKCSTKRQATFPVNYSMGYLETRKSQVLGDLFAMTSKKYPYNDNSLV